jgi:hypothetical protein
MAAAATVDPMPDLLLLGSGRHLAVSWWDPMCDKARFHHRALLTGSVQHPAPDVHMTATWEPLDDQSLDPISAELERTPGPTVTPCSSTSAMQPSLMALWACSSSPDPMAQVALPHVPSVSSPTLDTMRFKVGTPSQASPIQQSLQASQAVFTCLSREPEDHFINTS